MDYLSSRVQLSLVKMIVYHSLIFKSTSVTLKAFASNLIYDGKVLYCCYTRRDVYDAKLFERILCCVLRFQRIKKEQSPLFGVAFVCVFRQTSKFMVLVFLEARGKPSSSRKLLVKFSK